MGLYEWCCNHYSGSGVINMNITLAKYIKVTTPTDEEIINSVKATISGVESFVPMDKANTDYAEILRQVAAGTLTIADAD